MIRLLVVLAFLAASLPGPAGAQALRPDTVLAPPGGLRLVLLSEPSSAVAALRLSVPLPSSVDGTGADLVLRDLALERMRPLARALGAHVGAARTPWGLAFSVEGAATDIDYLADVLRAAVAEPDLAGPAFRTATDSLRERRARAGETAAGKLDAALRARLEPAVPAAAPPPPTPGAVLELWRRSVRPAATTLVADVPFGAEVVLAATTGLGGADTTATGTAAPAAGGGDGGQAPRVNVLRRWYGSAWQGGAPGDPRATVAAVLVADHLRAVADAGGYEAGVELIELRDRWALLVTGAAYQARAGAMRKAVDGALAGTRDALDADAVARAVARVRQDQLLRSRTPGGLVSTVGRAMEASGDPGAAAAAAAALDGVDLAAVSAFLDALVSGRPVTAEVKP